MTTATVKSAYFKGVRDGTPFIMMAAPFAVLFGVVASEAGLTLLQVMAFTLLVIAGAAQFAAVQLMTEDAAVALVLLAALAVNMRMMMYSAALVPHLGAAPLWQRALISYVNFDQSYMVSIAQYDARPDMTVAEKAAYFLGVASPITPSWVVATAIGALVGQAIPPEYALDSIMPIMFLALVAPMLRTVAQVVAALVSVAVALALIGLPSGLGLIIAAICAMFAGALTETLQERRA